MGIEIVYEPYPDHGKAALKKAANLKEGDYVRFRRKDNAELEKDRGGYVLKDKDGNEIKHNELVAMGRPKEVNDQKKKWLEMKNTPLVRENISREAGLRNPEELNAPNKKIFHMGGSK